MSSKAVITAFGFYFLAVFSCFADPQRAVEQKPVNPAVTAYQKKVYDLIGPRWYQVINRDVDLIALGKVRITFSIRPDGKVEDIQTISNTSNRHLEAVGREVIEGVRIPPIPSSVLKMLPNRRMEIDISFETFSNPK